MLRNLSGQRGRIVSKKDDPNGRWICDFRPLNRLTKKRVTALGDVFSKTRSLAAKIWKTGLDAWSGFNQMNATERARRLMQIITDFGVRQWTVLPFGVANGPSYFQEFMLDLYGGTGSSTSKPDMLGDAMHDLDAQLEVWVDDVQLGSGSVFNSSGEMDMDVTCAKGFKQHLKAIERVFERAATANLRFKLSKCHFCKFSLDTLGMVAGLGVVKTDPKKVQAISEWPRPSRPEDVEKFLATTVFIREHLSPRYAQISKPLRDTLAGLHEARKNKTHNRKAKYQPPAKPPADGSWPSFWNTDCEESFDTLKKMVINAVELQVPDFAGARDGSNRFHIWPDACNYGVGAALMQGYPKGTSSHPDSYYSQLGLNTWCTKVELVAKYGELKRRNKSCKAIDSDELEKIFETLGDQKRRAEYDETLGLASKRKSRVDLRPLGVFSKSLSKAQQAWPAWERELLAVLLTLVHF